MRASQPCLLNYTYIHTNTHTHTGYSTPHSYVNPSSNCCESPSYFFFFADLHVEGLTEVSTQSPNTQTQRIGSPRQWPCWSNALPICTLCCLGDHLGQTLTLRLAPGLRSSSASAAGQHDNLYKTLSNTWLTCPRPSPPTFTPAPANYPKTQTDDHVLAPLFASLSSSICCTHTHPYTCTCIHIHTQICPGINCVDINQACIGGDKSHNTGLTLIKDQVLW